MVLFFFGDSLETPLTEKLTCNLKLYFELKYTLDFVKRYFNLCPPTKKLNPRILPIPIFPWVITNIFLSAPVTQKTGYAENF